MSFKAGTDSAVTNENLERKKGGAHFHVMRF